jgi:hypothetical protein
VEDERRGVPPIDQHLARCDRACELDVAAQRLLEALSVAGDEGEKQALPRGRSRPSPE